MKTTRIAGVVAATAAAGLVYAPFAAADAAQPTGPDTATFGNQAELINGDIIQGWTISNLKPSSDTIPHPVTGTLWEATATDTALQGSVTPIVSNLNARAADGQTYRALFGAATPQGVNPATLAQGEKTTGKVYFDVTGSAPDSVVYNAGGQDLAIWKGSAPSSSGTGSTYRSYPSTSYPATSTATAAPASVPATTPEGTAAAPTATGAEALPAGSQGTPLPAGTPVPAGSQGTPLPAGSPGTPVPAGAQPAAAAPVEGAPAAAPAQGAPAASPGTQPAGSQGTPLPPGSDQVPAPTTYVPTP